MSRVPDRKRQRREYICKRGAASTLGALSTILYVVTAVVTLAFSFITLGCIFARDVWGAFLYAFAAAVCSVITRVSWRLMDRAFNAADAIAYIPPVTTKSFSAEEVLVRGSEDPPIELSEVLVRPAASQQEAGTEQLLRSSQGLHQ